MAISWDEKYSTGHDQLDGHHKKLFGYVADFQETCRHFNPERAATLIQFLDMYIQQHFTFEEICMHNFKCPAADANKKAHAQFRKAYADFKERYRESGGDCRVFCELTAMVELWITSHILKVDAQVRPCLKP